MGWALKKQKSSTRFPEKVKSYLNDRFLTDEDTGNKVSPMQVVCEMRRERVKQNAKETFSETKPTQGD